ncbi:hypothetical protein Pelo_6401 [Pelomyxa schiedti]|nr:hypothetical protein Pelo_6401 [Pelomyxa schiedti]
MKIPSPNDERRRHAHEWAFAPGITVHCVLLWDDGVVWGNKLREETGGHPELVVTLGRTWVTAPSSVSMFTVRLRNRSVPGKSIVAVFGPEHFGVVTADLQTLVHSVYHAGDLSKASCTHGSFWNKFQAELLLQSGVGIIPISLGSAYQRIAFCDATGTTLAIMSLQSDLYFTKSPKNGSD